MKKPNILKQVFTTAFLTFITLPVFAGTGITCSGFNKFPENEKLRYLEGYQLGAAMELNYFKYNVLTSKVKKSLESSSDETLKEVAKWGIDEYLIKKYNLINMSLSYPSDFYSALKHECAIKLNGDIGLFDIIPSTLEKMHGTGKYPVPGK